jgi:hypothetical protein
MIWNGGNARSRCMLGVRKIGRGTTGKTVIAVRHFLCRTLSIGRTAKASLCRVPRTSRTAQINAR